MPPTVTSGMSVSSSLSPSSSPSSSIWSSSAPHTTPIWTSTFDSGFPMTQTASPTPSSSPSQSGSFGQGGVPVATIFYFIAFISSLVALAYTIHRVRRNRRRRLQEQNGDNEAGGRNRHTTTYRPEDDEGCPPPQYRAYAADETSLDPEMTIIYPAEAHYATSHLGLLSSTPLSSPSADDDDSVNAYMVSSRPTLQTNSTGTTSTTTTTITTTTTTATASGSTTVSPSSSPIINQRSIMAPNANILITTPLNSSDRLERPLPVQPQSEVEQQHGGHMSTAPMISAPSPAFTFTVSRHLPILRNGLAGSNNIHQSGSRRRSSTPVSSSGPASTSDNRLTTPDIQSVSQINSPNRNSFAGSNSSIGSGSGSQSGLVTAQQQQPVLNRLRSQGPPPYIPLSPDSSLPRLPPEYDTAVAPVNTSTATPGSI